MKLIWTPLGPTVSRFSVEGEEPDAAPEGGGGPPAEPEPSPDENTSEVDFAALSKEMEEDDEEPAEPAEPEETPEAEPAPAEPSAEEPPASAKAEEKEELPAEPAPAEPEPTEPAPQSEPVTPEKIEEAYQRYQEQILPQLEQQYQLSEEQAAEIQDDPAKAIPKLAAQIHYRAQVAAYTGVMSQVPQIVSSIMKRSQEVERAESAFYSRWPELQKPEHADKVDSTLRAWRNANPNATTEEMIEKAGVMAMLTLGLDPNPEPSSAEASDPVQPEPARPAGTGGAGAARQPDGGASNVFEQMAEQMLEEEI